MPEFSIKKITKGQSQDTGMAMVLLMLLLLMHMKREAFLLAAVALHVVNMIVPRIYAPIAVLWLGLSHLLGIISSKILLSVLFFVVVTPVGILRRLFGKDALKLHAFNASQDSVMSPRNHRFSSKDLERPY